MRVEFDFSNQKRSLREWGRSMAEGATHGQMQRLRKRVDTA
jgi:hypothetical protein